MEKSFRGSNGLQKVTVWIATFEDIKKLLRLRRYPQNWMFQMCFQQRVPKNTFTPIWNFAIHNTMIVSLLLCWHLQFSTQEIIMQDFPVPFVTYFDPRLLTMNDVAVKETLSARRDRTTSILCSSLHAFSHSPKNSTWH